MSTTLKASVCALACVFIVGAAPITISLVSPTLSGIPGATVDFRGTLSNTTNATVFLNSANLNTTLPSAMTDLTPFFSGPVSLPSLQSSGVIDLFKLTIPTTATAGPYTGIFTVLGGAASTSQDILGSTNFGVNVNASGTTGTTGSASVPEPGSLGFVLLGAGLFVAARRTR